MDVALNLDARQLAESFPATLPGLVDQSIDAQPLGGGIDRRDSAVVQHWPLFRLSLAGRDALSPLRVFADDAVELLRWVLFFTHDAVSQDGPGSNEPL